MYGNHPGALCILTGFEEFEVWDGKRVRFAFAAGRVESCFFWGVDLLGGGLVVVCYTWEEIWRSPVILVIFIVNVRFLLSYMTSLPILNSPDTVPPRTVLSPFSEHFLPFILPTDPPLPPNHQRSLEMRLEISYKKQSKWWQLIK